MQNRLIVLLSILTLVIIIACNKDEPISEPNLLDCDNIYPKYASIINYSVFNFEWCSVENATEYHLQASEKEGFSEIMFDTIITETSVKSIIWLIDHGNGNSVEYFPFKWGTRYFWRVAPIKNGIEQSWSNTYTFKTHDIRDDIIGDYSVTRREYRVMSSQAASFLMINDTTLVDTNILIEKIPNSRGLRVIEENNNLDIGLELIWTDYGWRDEYLESASWCRFKINIDSFSIFHTTSTDPTWHSGYVYSGRE